MRPRLIRSRDGPHRDRQPVPRVDRGHGHRQRHDFLLRKLLLYLLIDFIRHMSLRNQCYSLGPRQRRPLAIGIKRRFFPRIQSIESLLRLARRPRVFGMHVEAICASIDLRRAHFDEFEQRLLESGLPRISLQPDHCVINLWIHFHDVDSRFHDFLLILWMLLSRRTILYSSSVPFAAASFAMTLKSSRVVTSPETPPFSATSRNSRRMIFPLRVLGNKSAKRTSLGRAIVPIVTATCSTK